MRSITLMCVFAGALFVPLAIPIPLAANDDGNQHKYHHYKFIDLGTFGGPNSNISIEPWTPAINSAGTVVGFADTAVPTSAPGCYNPVANNDCYRSHAFL